MFWKNSSFKLEILQIKLIDLEGTYEISNITFN